MDKIWGKKKKTNTTTKKKNCWNEKQYDEVAEYMINI